LPEGPEVKIIAESLAENISGLYLHSYEILSGRYKKKGDPSGFSTLSNLLPLRIIGAGCHGKFIFIILEDNSSIWCTLGMTGGWKQELDSHSRVKFCTSGRDFYFSDVRNFGTLKFTQLKQDLISKLESLGPDMLSDDVDGEIFSERIKRKKRKTIVEALMDQSIIAGVGNYLKSESLYYAKISPHRTCDSLSAEELIKLNKAIKTVIRASYLSGGATINSYSDFNGKIGEYSRRFAVYDQESDPEGRKVLKEKTKDQRSTFWVPEFQS